MSASIALNEISNQFNIIPERKSSYYDYVDYSEKEEDVLRKNLSSKEGKKVNSRLLDILNQEYKVNTIKNAVKGLLELWEISQDTHSAGWDGYDALPISKSAFNNTLIFLYEMPDQITFPEILPEPDGNVGLTWENKRGSLTLKILNDNEAIYATLDNDGSKGYGIFSLASKSLVKINEIIEKYS